MEIEKYMVSTDQQLISMSLDGDSVAFEHLFNRYQDSILRLHMQRTGGNSNDANDLLQETFIKVFLNLHTYNTSYTFGQWVYTIARNTFIDFVRKRRDDISIDSMKDGYASYPLSALPTPEESLINQQQREQLEHYLTKMRPRYRKLIEMRFFGDYSYDEMAQKLDLPLGTVKTQIHRARAQLCALIVDNSDIRR